MSGIVKTLGKVFLAPIAHVLPKKYRKVVRKVALGALMVGAVVMTGGAALGVLPSMGAMVGGLGLSAGLTTALTGAISTGAVGAVTGMLTGGFKGATKGFLLGAATGGVLGGLGVLGPNGLIGGGKAVAGAASNSLSSAAPSFATASLPGATTAPALGLAAPGTISGGIGAGLSSAAPSFASAALPAASTNLAALPAMPSLAAPAAASGGGIGGFMAQNPMMTMMAGQALTGLATPSASTEAAKAAEKEGATLFSGAYSNGGFGAPGGYAVPGSLKAGQPTKRFRLNRQTMEVEEVG